MSTVLVPIVGRPARCPACSASEMALNRTLQERELRPMILVTEVLGVSSEPRFAAGLHELAHDGKVEIITIEQADALRRRLRVTTDKGTEVILALEKGQQLGDGAILVFEHQRAIVARLNQQRWLRVSPKDKAAASEVGYFVGNLHWQVHFDHSDILIAIEGNVSDYEARLRHFIENDQITLRRDE
jgi:urease accessory protein